MHADQYTAKAIGMPYELADRLVSTRDMSTTPGAGGELVDKSIKVNRPAVPMLLSDILVELGAIKTTGKIEEGQPVPVFDSTLNGERVTEGADPVGSGDAVTRTVADGSPPADFPANPDYSSRDETGLFLGRRVFGLRHSGRKRQRLARAGSMWMALVPSLKNAHMNR